MSYLSLYRKYRPKYFKDVIGQTAILQILKNAIKTDKIANAYIFAGVKGTGKTSIAKIFANAMNCQNNIDGDVCGKCLICKDFINNQVMDVIELDAASNNGVDDVRKIIDAAIVLPTKLRKKVYIIDEAHMLTTQAWNALLKIVEEPPKYVVFIFATTEVHKIPSTIISRCQCFIFNKIMATDINKLLINVCEKEKIKYTIEAIETIGQLANGSARDSLSILDQVAIYTNNNITIADIHKIYGIIDNETIIKFLNLFITNEKTKVFQNLNDFIQSGINFSFFIKMLADLLTDKLIYLETNNKELLSKTTKETINQLLINDKSLLIKLLDIWQDAYVKISKITDIKLIMDNTVVKSLSLFNNENNHNIKPTNKYEQDLTIFQKHAPLDDLFELEQINSNTITSPSPVYYDKKNTNISSFPTNDQILCTTVANRDKTFENMIQNLLKQIKSGEITEQSFSDMLLAKTVFVASKNSVILAFNDEVDAKILNKTAKTKDFILTCCKFFEKPIYVVGYSIQQLNNLKNQIQDAKKKKILPLSIQPLRDILDEDASIEQIAFNTLVKNTWKDK